MNVKRDVSNQRHEVVAKARSKKLLPSKQLHQYVPNSSFAFAVRVSFRVFENKPLCRASVTNIVVSSGGIKRRY